MARNREGDLWLVFDVPGSDEVYVSADALAEIAGALQSVIQAGVRFLDLAAEEEIELCFTASPEAGSIRFHLRAIMTKAGGYAGALAIGASVAEITGVGLTDIFQALAGVLVGATDDMSPGARDLARAADFRNKAIDLASLATERGYDVSIEDGQGLRIELRRPHWAPPSPIPRDRTSPTGDLERLDEIRREVAAVDAELEAGSRQDEDPEEWFSRQRGLVEYRIELIDEFEEIQKRRRPNQNSIRSDIRERPIKTPFTRKRNSRDA